MENTSETTTPEQEKQFYLSDTGELLVILFALAWTVFWVFLFQTYAGPSVALLDEILRTGMPPEGITNNELKLAGFSFALCFVVAIIVWALMPIGFYSWLKSYEQKRDRT